MSIQRRKKYKLHLKKTIHMRSPLGIKTSMTNPISGRENQTTIEFLRSAQTESPRTLKN